MRTHLLTIASFLLLSSAAWAAGPLEPQSSIPWPPKAVAKQAKGKVPDFKAKNQICMDCHKDIMAVKTGRKNVPNLHRLHLESKKTAYKGENRDCLVCHETISVSKTKAPDREGWFAKGDVYHPNVMRYQSGVWKKLIVRSEEAAQHSPVGTLQPPEIDIYKTSLKRLVCMECHGPDSKIKTFFGAPVASK